MARYDALVEAIEALVEEWGNQLHILRDLPPPISVRPPADCQTCSPASLLPLFTFEGEPIEFFTADGAQVESPFGELPFSTADYQSVAHAHFTSPYSPEHPIRLHEPPSKWWTPGRLVAYRYHGSERFSRLVKAVETAARAAGVMRELIFPLGELSGCFDQMSEAARTAPIDRKRAASFDGDAAITRGGDLCFHLWAWLSELTDEGQSTANDQASLVSLSELAALTGVSPKSLENGMSKDREAFKIPYGTGAGRSSRKWEYNSNLRSWLLRRWPAREMFFPESGKEAKRFAADQLSQVGTQQV